MKLYNKTGEVVGEIYDTEITVPTQGKKIALVVGHQENKQGAYGSKGIGEWQFNYELIHSLKHSGKNDVEVFMRDKNIAGYTNQMLNLHEQIDKWGADISIEFHFNSFSNSAAQGHEVLYCLNSDKGGEVATALNNSLDKYLSTSNRGVKYVTMSNNGGGFCCRGKSAAIIIEPFFGSHQHRFIDGGDLREPLKQAIIEFLDSV